MTLYYSEYSYHVSDLYSFFFIVVLKSCIQGQYLRNKGLSNACEKLMGHAIFFKYCATALGKTNEK